MFKWFKRHKTFDARKKEAFVEFICGMLQMQFAMTERKALEDDYGSIDPKAIGYIYGFIDAALRRAGQDMADPEVGVPITFQVLRHLFPDRYENYMTYLSDNLRTNATMGIGMMVGGQQFYDMCDGKIEVPMGLARLTRSQE